MKELIPRINELANKSKEEGLTDEEKQEQKELREKYLAKFRGNFRSQILNTKLVDKDGNDITPQKVKDEKNKNNSN